MNFLSDVKFSAVFTCYCWRFFIRFLFYYYFFLTDASYRSAVWSSRSKLKRHRCRRRHFNRGICTREPTTVTAHSNLFGPPRACHRSRSIVREDWTFPERWVFLMIFFLLLKFKSTLVIATKLVRSFFFFISARAKILSTNFFSRKKSVLTFVPKITITIVVILVDVQSVWRFLFILAVRVDWYGMIFDRSRSGPFVFRRVTCRVLFWDCFSFFRPKSRLQLFCFYFLPFSMLFSRWFIVAKGTFSGFFFFFNSTVIPGSREYYMPQG